MIRCFSIITFKLRDIIHINIIVRDNCDNNNKDLSYFFRVGNKKLSWVLLLINKIYI